MALAGQVSRRGLVSVGLLEWFIHCFTWGPACQLLSALETGRLDSIGSRLLESSLEFRYRGGSLGQDTDSLFTERLHARVQCQLMENID